MRNELCAALVALADNPDMIFLTGDLGFMALEPLQSALNRRFINAGVAEQNMVSVGAAMAKDGWQVWCYSIAPFCFARPLEQIRNDVCLHNLPVRLIGNGGGYGYGVMGPTHHAVDDYGILLTLPNMHVFVPAFNEDVPATIQAAAKQQSPCYVRLGRGELPAHTHAPSYAPWRCVLHGTNGVIISVGPIAGMVWQTVQQLPTDQQPSVWIVSELPVLPHALPPLLVEQLTLDGRMIVVEEHVLHGGLTHMVTSACAMRGIRLSHVIPLHAHSLALGTYGSQQFLRNHSNLASIDVRTAIDALQQQR